MRAASTTSARSCRPRSLTLAPGRGCSTRRRRHGLRPRRPAGDPLERSDSFVRDVDHVDERSLEAAAEVVPARQPSDCAGRINRSAPSLGDAGWSCVAAPTASAIGMIPSMCRGWSGGCADGRGNPAVQRSFDVAHECRVDDEVTERLDEGHVGGAEPAAGFDVDGSAGSAGSASTEIRSETAPSAEEGTGRPQQARRPRRRIGAALTRPVDTVISRRRSDRLSSA